MFRISTSLFALAIWASATLGASAQQYPPPPEGAPQSNNPYAQPYQPNTPTTTNAPNPAMLARAKSVFAQLQEGKIDRSQLATGPNTNFTDASIANAQKMIGNLGKPTSFVQQQSMTQGSVSAAIYLVRFNNGQSVDFLFAVDSQGKIAGLSLGTPH
jgi:hypothetical protein